MPVWLNFQIRLAVPFDGEGAGETGERVVRVPTTLVMSDLLSCLSL